MKKVFFYFLSALILLASCSSKDGSDKGKMEPGVYSGRVLQSIDVESYTYLEIATDEGDIWIAAPPVAAEEGRTVYYTNPMEMRNFNSKSLDRTFGSIYFVNNVYFDPDKAGGEKSGMKMTHGNMMESKTAGSSKGTNAPMEDGIEIEKAEGGMTIAEIYEKAADLAGEKIRVRGKVVKYSPNIMDLNWVHLQDGTDFEEKYDLTLTSDQEFIMGETVTVEGILKNDVDLGFGYFYPVLIEESERK